MPIAMAKSARAPRRTSPGLADHRERRDHRRCDAGGYDERG